MKKRKHSSVWTAVALAMALAVISYYPENHGGSGPSRGEKAPDSSPDFPAHDASTPDSSTPDSSAPDSIRASEAAAPPRASTVPSYADDFYSAVNRRTLEEWSIPADQPEMSWFRVSREDSYEKVNKIIQQVSSLEPPLGNTRENAREGALGNSQERPRESRDMYNIRALNLTGLDKEARDRGGYGQAAGAFLKEVDGAGTLDQLLRSCLQFHKDYGYYSLIGIEYEGDSQDSSVKAAYVCPPDKGLTREIWFSEDDSNKKRVEEYIKYLTTLQEINGASHQEAVETVAQVTAMMKDLASSSLTIQEAYDSSKTYNVYTAKDAAAIYSGALPFSLLEDVYGVQQTEKTIIPEPDLCRKLGQYLSEEHLPLLKRYVKTCLYSDLSRIAGTKSLDAAQVYETSANGIEQKKSFDRTVSESVQQFLGYQCGRIYCQNYFDESAKQDVTAMIQKIIRVYDQRLASMDWMSGSTRQEARKKLANLTIKVGYPDQWPQDRYELELTPPDQGGLYIDNILSLKKAEQDFRFETRQDPVDRVEWGMTPQTVNAYYNPGNNEIVFPAAILQAPFYSANGNPVANLGGIGTVIGHEITHAFDTTGSQYDEKGNLRDWWTDEDRQHFKELGQKVIDYYSLMEVNGIPVNGSLSATENIADLGAVSCLTEIAKKEGYDLKELYKAYASVWASKYRDEYLSYIMSNDVHAPGIIRVNGVLSATDGFYTAFDIKEGDGMYRKPEDRPRIW